MTTATSPTAARSAAAQPKRPLAERIVPRRLADRMAARMWDKTVPRVARLSPKLLKPFAGMMSPNDFARSVAAASEESLQNAMQGRMRGVILDEVVDRMATELRPDRAAGFDAVIQMDITGGPDGSVDRYQLAIFDGKCKSEKGTSHEPKVTLELDAVNFLKLATGVETGIDMYLGGRLKFDGAAMLLTRLTSMFNIPDPKA